MGHVYAIKDSVRIQAALVWFLMSSALGLAILTVISLLLCAFFGLNSDYNILQSVPFPIGVLLVICGVYIGVGVVCLWLAMWAYWGWLESAQRVRWFLLLLLGMHYGAMLYAFYVWKKGLIRRVAV